MAEESQENWAPGEVVRVVERMMRSLDEFEVETRASLRQLEDDFKAHYVSKELLAATLAPVVQHKDAATRWVHELVGPLLTGGLVAVVMYAIQHHT